MAHEKTLPSFARPPVTEVAVAVEFEDAGLQMHHIGLFWERLRAQYPTVQDLPPISEITSESIARLFTVPPLRRMLASSSDQASVIQLQSDRLVVNWRQASKELQYPRFRNIFDAFRSHWQALQAFLSEFGLPPLKERQFDLTYVNQLDQGGESLSNYLESTFNVYKWQGPVRELLQDPTAANFTWVFDLPESKGKFTASLFSAMNENKPTVVLSLRCTGKASSGYSLEDWFETAHEWIVRGFTDLTTKSAQDGWVREN